MPGLPFNSYYYKQETYIIGSPFFKGKHRHGSYCIELYHLSRSSDIILAFVGPIIRAIVFV